MYHFLTTQFSPPPTPTSRLEPGIRDRRSGRRTRDDRQRLLVDMGITQPVQVVEELNLSASQRKMVLGGTAARILKL